MREIRLTNRREFLRLSAAGAASAALLAACGPTATPSPTAAPAKPAAQPTAAPAQPTAAPAKPTEAPKPAAQATKPAAQPTAAPAKPAAAQVELNWFLPLSAAPEIKIWEDFVDRLQKANPNIVVKGSYEPWANYWTKLQTVMAGGAIPDVIWLHSTRIGEWASKDVVKSLDELLAADKIDPKEFVIIDAFRYKGKLYAIPKDNGLTALWYNVDMFQKAGLPVPAKEHTWDKFLEAAKRLTVDQAGKSSTESGFDAKKTAVWGTNMLDTTPRSYVFQAFFKSTGGKLYDAEMRQVLIDQPDSIDALQWLADLRIEHKVAPLPGAITEPGNPFRIGKVAMAFDHHAMAFFLHDEKRTFKWDETYPPRGKGGLTIVAGATGFAIPKASKHPDEAWTLAKFMTGEEQQRVIVAQRRWAAGRTKIVPEQYVPDYHTANYKMVHVDTLIGVGHQAIADSPAPPPLAEIEQVWNSAFDPVWLGKAKAKDIVKDLKAKVDELLQRPTKI